MFCQCCHLRLLFCPIVKSQAFSGPQSSAPQRPSMNLQLKAGLSKLLFMTLCMWHIHCCSSGPEDVLGGSCLRHFHALLLALPCKSTADLPRQKNPLPDQLLEVACTLCTWIYPCQHVHLQAVSSLLSEQADPCDLLCLISKDHCTLLICNPLPGL